MNSQIVSLFQYVQKYFGYLLQPYSFSILNFQLTEPIFLRLSSGGMFLGCVCASVLVSANKLIQAGSRSETGQMSDF